MIASVVVGFTALLGAPSVSTAVADPPACARTADPSTPANPSPGASCWTEATPYPFGFDGDPADTTSAQACALPNPLPDGLPGNLNSACLTVTSMAFRAPNRGLAATSSDPSTVPTPYGVWLYNGTRWYPDPAFPGQASCPGNKVLWAGKLDYWLVGAKNFGALCRFDGASFRWEVLPVPRETMAQLRPPNPLDPLDLGDLSRNNGDIGIRTGACLTWNDCWFFGSFGSILRWDGAALRDASPDRVAQPWLRIAFTAAVSRVLAPTGRSLTVAVSASGEGIDGSARVQPRPGQQTLRQMYASSAGGALAAVDITLPTDPAGQDRHRTDAVAVDFDAGGRGWIAANPSPRPRESAQTPEPAPVLAVSPSGADPACPGPPARRFMSPYRWSSIAVLPDNGDALVGGRDLEAVIARIGCDGSVAETRFRVPDPLATTQPAPLVPLATEITSLASTASNDAWAGTTPRNGFRPRLFRLTDGTPPKAPPGDDDEPRPIEVVEDPTIFVEEPAPVDPPIEEVPGEAVVVPGTVTRRPRQLPALYEVRPRKPREIKRGRYRGRFLLTIRFRVRRPVTVGLRALRGTRVVNSSGLKRFRGTRGQLTLTLDRRRWPTRVRFYYPTGAAAAQAAAPAIPRSMPESRR